MASAGTIVIVEDEIIIGRDMQQTLRASGYRVDHVAQTAEEAMAVVEQDCPDLALVDIALEGGGDGVDLARRFRDEWGLPFVYVTAHSDAATLDRVKETEPLGYVVKPFDAAQLIGTVKVAFHRIVRERERDAAREEEASRGAAKTAELQAKAEQLEAGLRRIAELVTRTGVAATPPREHPTAVIDVDGLSRREQQVLGLLLANRRVPAIARTLEVSPHTVRNHLKAIFRKVGVHSQAELIELLDRRSAPRP